MVTLVGPNEGISYNFDLGTFWKTENDLTLKLIDGILHLGVIDKDLPTQPGSPTNGDRYILPAGATGAAWAGHDTEIAIFINNIWEFHVPKLAWLAFVQDEELVYFWNATAWILLNTPASISNVVTALPGSGTLTMDLSTGVRNFATILTGAATLAFSNVPAGVQTEISVKVVQDGVGGHVLTLPAGAIYAGGVTPTPSVASNTRDRYLFLHDENGILEGNIVGQLYA